MIGFGGILYNVTAISLIQAITPDRILGRANASRRFVVWGVVPLGGFTGGALASTIGLRETMVVGALGGLLTIVPILASPLRSVGEMSELEARVSVVADRLGEQRARVAPPGEVRLRPQPRQPVAHRRQPLRVGGEPGERVLELVARRGIVEVVRDRGDRAPVEVELAARVAAGREQQLGPADRGLQLVRVVLDLLPREPGEAE